MEPRAAFSRQPAWERQIESYKESSGSLGERSDSLCPVQFVWLLMADFPPVIIRAKAYGAQHELKSISRATDWRAARGHPASIRYQRWKGGGKGCYPWENAIRIISSAVPETHTFRFLSPFETGWNAEKPRTQVLTYFEQNQSSTEERIKARHVL